MSTNPNRDLTQWNQRFQGLECEIGYFFSQFAKKIFVFDYWTCTLADFLAKHTFFPTKKKYEIQEKVSLK